MKIVIDKNTNDLENIFNMFIKNFKKDNWGLNVFPIKNINENNKHIFIKDIMHERHTKIKQIIVTDDIYKIPKDILILAEKIYIKKIKKFNFNCFTISIEKLEELNIEDLIEYSTYGITTFPQKKYKRK